MPTIWTGRLADAAGRPHQALGTAAFHDITSGDSGPYPALPGYDLATGIGTMDVARALRIIG